MSFCGGVIECTVLSHLVLNCQYYTSSRKSSTNRSLCLLRHHFISIVVMYYVRRWSLQFQVFEMKDTLRDERETVERINRERWEERIQESSRVTRHADVTSTTQRQTIQTSSESGYAWLLCAFTAFFYAIVRLSQVATSIVEQLTLHRYCASVIHKNRSCQVPSAAIWARSPAIWAPLSGFNARPPNYNYQKKEE